ncbi:MAG: hypothetical protein JXM70_07330 [Pirellulales bacterium]|nr:hypothetical protein [Pirellulales bacterium]
MINLHEYYAHDAVRKRMVQFLGSKCLEDATSCFLTSANCSPVPDYHPRMPTELWSCLDQDMEVKRSLWDRRSLIIHIDIEYVNFDYPAEPYIDPLRSLELQRPVVRCLQEHLLDYGISPLHLLSGRGHHLIWRVNRSSEAFRRLASLGILVDTLSDIYQVDMPPHREPVGVEIGAAFAGVGQVMEYLAHVVLSEVSSQCPIPIQITEVETSQGLRGREILSLDLSEYGDPLHTRIISIPFSAYHKPVQRRDVLGSHVVDELPPFFLVPLFEMDDRTGLLAMRDPLQAVEIARYASVEIPEHNEGTLALTESYAKSQTAAFHRWFYSQKHESPKHWPDTYDKMPLDSLPPCAQKLLVEPNDSLLKPKGIRHIVRVLMGLDWHPRHIAGLIRSKYERDYGWGNLFFHYDAATRADFYTRLFAGLIELGLDDLNDFRCQDILSAEECADGTCDNYLNQLREKLMERENYE